MPLVLRSGRAVTARPPPPPPGPPRPLPAAGAVEPISDQLPAARTRHRRLRSSSSSSSPPPVPSAHHPPGLNDVALLIHPQTSTLLEIFPAEILRAIVHHVDKKHALCLVHPTFREIALPYLYETAVLTVEQFNALTLPVSRMLGSREKGTGRGSCQRDRLQSIV